MRRRFLNPNPRRSGVAFLLSQLLDVRLFDYLRSHRIWWFAPFFSTITASAFDSLLFGTIAFAGTEMPFETWPFIGDLPHWVLASFNMNPHFTGP